ncbi:stress response protein SCP2 [Clostridium tetanomorphum]|uniref:TerD family protein n=1 Tax=Clostridium tetanomorphum TaxID=1553 RepID=A0A923EE65_CLOTT|nr:TerD family protein [Clostridium tetanomorphum]KAJ50116.1 tellurium resistance protein terE [Clostridium tetanomorphum DSM 665]MBC2399215.1 TerD family protein [Clostridium tetanomorphum]MBP1862861.1 stress response protein SCP2 [Clostridium tetanomorphum]NRS86998.1 stress response protein SCP2 [Clostridium tetanomorphum]NRZ99217.1 stress response protein SCP2 [Clostridium tetanomorphum]
MTVNLQKGQKVDLSKGEASLSKIMIGLGWDPVAQAEGKGLLGGIFRKAPENIDCDASVIMLDANDKLTSNRDIVYFGNLKSACGSVRHTGDNLTGDGDGDDEQILVDLSKVPKKINKLVFVVNIYDCTRRNQHFGLIRNAYIRVVNSTTRQEFIKYNLSDDYSAKTCLITGEIYRHGDGWKFAAIGEGTNDDSLKSIVAKYC